MNSIPNRKSKIANPWFAAAVLSCVTGIMVSRAAVVINEIHYHPDVKTELVEFVEIHNAGNTAINLTGWTLAQAIDYTFGPNSMVSPGGYITVARDPEALKRKFGAAAVGPWQGKFANEGDKLILCDTSGTTVDEVDYQLGFPWPTVGDSPGHSIELINPAFDNSLGGSWRISAATGSAVRGPTPGARNAAFADNLPPHIRQVSHSPKQPGSGEAVRVSAKVTDADGVAEVHLQYQVVEPGNYIELTDPLYSSLWTTIAMNDLGADGDEQAGDQVFTATVPQTVQAHRRLVRYRVGSADIGGRRITAPYADDPQPNFAYFVYDGVPPWSGAIQPNSTNPARRARVTFGLDVMRRLPVYHLISKASAVQQAQYGGYTGDLYRWAGTLAYDGKVYDHIHFRARGGVWRYAMGKNMWKFDFNRGHSFESRDDFGNKYRFSWDKLNLGACIQQGDYLHRGEQGMFESVGFRLFNLAGVEAPLTHFVQFRVIDGAAEANPTNQYDGDFWGLYLAIEQEDGRFLDQHDLPDGNFYKMENGTGELNNQGPIGAANKSDLNAFMTGYRSSTPPADAWWRSRFDLHRYSSYQTIVQGIHHYDICYGKNYFYFLNPLTGRWSVHPWDLDLTWADNMFDRNCGGTDEFKNRVLARPTFNLEYKNRIREVRDLLFNTDQAYRLIDEYAAIIHDPDGGPSFVAADRAMWDYNPILASSLVNPSKSGQGRFYQIVPTKDFPGMVKKMKDYVVTRGAILEGLAGDTLIPATPVISVPDSRGFPVNRLNFALAAYSGANPFAALKWRLGEVTPAGEPAFDLNQPKKYEIEAAWESNESAQFSSEIVIPPGVARVGRTYRARARVKDNTGRWSHWSDPIEFTASEPDNAVALTEHLRISELMYDPVGGTNFEFLELVNASSTITLDLGGARFTQGIDFTFSPRTLLPPGERLLVVKSEPAGDFAAFRTHYALDSTLRIVGPFVGSLDNNGERISLKTAAGGADLLDFEYGDGRGWPLAVDGAGHSLVPLESIASANDGLDYPGAWRASTFIGGSPGRADPILPPTVVLNEFAAADSNDWIELHNVGAGPMELVDWYLSDDATNLRKWAVPRTTIPPAGWISFDEATGFRSSPPTGFGLSSSGEQILLSHLPGSGRNRVADGVRFKAQDPGRSLGRFPDGNGFWLSMEPSRGTANRQPGTPAIVLNELMYHPASAAGAQENVTLEYVEILNPGTVSVNLFNANGGWRLDGGVSFTFPTHAILPPGESLLVVSFSPTNAAALNAFRSSYGPANAFASIYGPYQGTLKNSSDRVAVEKPQASAVVSEPSGWAILDEVIYSDQLPWPSAADGSGQSLHRRGPAAAGNDPANWQASVPSPGRVDPPSADSDGDGLPDDWERLHELNPNSSVDAAVDSDGDSFSNLNEFRAGTNPRDPKSVLAVGARLTPGGQAVLQFTATSGKSYAVEYRDSLGSGNWMKLAEINAQPSSRMIEVPDTIPQSGPARFYRLVVR